VTPKTSQNVIKNVQKIEVLERFSDTPAACVFAWFFFDFDGFWSILLALAEFLFACGGTCWFR
jgi:hypothetical protein